MATVTLRGRFAPGTTVELVDGAFPDPMIPEPIKAKKVTKAGEVTFDGLEAGREYVVRDKDRTRSARITPRADRPPETSLVQPDPLTPTDDPPPAVEEDTPRIVHEGPRHTRMLASTRGDKFAGEADEAGRLTKPRKEIRDYSSVRQADFAGAQESDTAVGVATPLVVEEVQVQRRWHDQPDPVSFEQSDEWPEVGTEMEARPMTVDELRDETKPKKGGKS